MDHVSYHRRLQCYYEVICCFCVDCLLYLCSSQVKGQIRTVCWEIEWGEEEEEAGGSHLMTGQQEEEGSGEVVSVSTLLVLIGVHRKVFDK